METVNPSSLMKGFIFLIDNIDLSGIKDFSEKADIVMEKAPVFKNLNRGNIFHNEKSVAGHPNEIIIFDLEDTVVRGAYFKGFLYPNGKVNGKVHYKAGFKSYGEDKIEGDYERANENNIVIFGKYILPNGNPFSEICIVLSKDLDSDE